MPPKRHCWGGTLSPPFSRARPYFTVRRGCFHRRAMSGQQAPPEKLTVRTNQLTTECVSAGESSRRHPYPSHLPAPAITTHGSERHRWQRRQVMFREAPSVNGNAPQRHSLAPCHCNTYNCAINVYTFSHDRVRFPMLLCLALKRCAGVTSAKLVAPDF